MSLKVWLPLDGDLRNLGTSDVEVTNNGATIDDAGKIGKCYYFNGSAQYLQFNKTLGDIYVKDFSLCVWLKPTDDTRGVIISEYASAGASNVALELLANRAVRIYWNSSPDWNTGIILNKNEWSHIVITKQNNTLKLYVNGVYKIEKTTTLSERPSTACIRIGDDYRGGTGVSYMGYMNDVRIYDHCLSVAEVREIAQGLILHYKLDASSEEKITTIPSTNVYSYPTFNTSATGGGWYHWGPSGHSGSYGQNTDKKYIYNKNNTYSHWITEDAGTGKYYLLYQNPAFEGGYRSLQAIIKEENGLPITESICYPGWNARNGGVPNNKWTSIKNLGDGFYYCRCEGISQDGSNDLVGIDVMPGYKIYVSECYLEDNIETCSPIFTYSSNIIQDSSGYGHNGTLNSSSTLNTNSPRYSSSLYFSPNIIVTGNNLFSQGTLLSEFTWMGWVRRKYDDGKTKLIHSGPINVGLYTDYSLYIGWKSAKTDGTTTGNGAAGGSATVPLNTWAHICITYKDGIGNFYINGNKTKTFNYSSYGTFIETYEQNYLGSSNWDGDLSDIRIYTTALLDTDIKLLYNIGMRVDNSQGIHSFEFYESGSRELLQGINITSSYSTHSSTNNPYTKYQNGELYFNTNGSSAGSDYIPISPSGKTYYYDFDISINAGNQFYIGFERYDANKTSRSNNACTYIYASNSSTNINRKHIFGTVNLSTDGVNPCAFIALRILNGWSGTTSGVTGIATIHRMSLREVNILQKPQIGKNGITTIDELKEYQTASIYKKGLFEANNFIEN